MMLLLLSIFFMRLNHYCTYCAANVNLRPRQLVNSVLFGRRFTGHVLPPFESNSDEQSNYFKLLEVDGNSLLVGARNAAYNLSIDNLEVQHVLDWSPPGQIVEDCLMKGKSRLECHNYIRVMVRQANGRCLICGTHAFSPKCREYFYTKGDRLLQHKREFDGQAISPYDPRDNSTAVYISETDEIYVGTVSDFAGNDPLIYRKRLSDVDGLRTQRDDLKVLDSPNFVGSFAYGEHVYFWYREWAAESNDMDHQVYARVARVCKNDHGGARPAHERWTSFVKARLNCSLPSNTPFYFNELQAITEPVPYHDGSPVVYGVFTTPESSLRLCAVCLFRMETIQRIFDYGHFKIQKTPQSMWMPYRPRDVLLPVPRPGSCTADSSKLAESTVSFITKNPLMHETVPPVGNKPLLVQGPERAELSQIAVAPQVESVRGFKHNALYLGTSDGRILKIYDPGDSDTALVEAIRVFPQNIPIVNLIVAANQLIVVTDDEVAVVALYHCAEQKTCSGCVHLQDAHCAWDLNSARCVGQSGRKWKSGNFVQNVNLGRSEQCPEGAIDPDYYAVDEVHSDRVTQWDQCKNSVSMQALFIAVIIAITIASAGGFLVGYRIFEWRSYRVSQHSSNSSTGSDNDLYVKARLTRHDSLVANKVEHVYEMAPNKDTISLVLSMAHNGAGVLNSDSNDGSGMNTPKICQERTVFASLNNASLPRDYKVKKVYL